VNGQPVIDYGRDAALYRPIYETGKGFYVGVFVLLGLYGWATYMYFNQVEHGLGITGMNQPITWGFYIVNADFSNTASVKGGMASSDYADGRSHHGNRAGDRRSASDPGSGAP